MRYCLALLCMLACLTTTTRATGPAANDRVKMFFRTVIDGDTAKAFNALMEGSLIPSSQPDAVSRLKNQFENALRVYGRPVGFDLVEEKNFSPSLVRFVYLFQLEKYPLIWEFFFYRATDRWLPIGVRFNDSLAPFKFDLPVATPSAANGATQD